MAEFAAIYPILMASQDYQTYADSLRSDLELAYGIASQARKKGFDPSDEVEVKIAKDISARVEGIVGPPGIAIVIRGLEASGMSREDIAFEIARQIASGQIIKGNKEILIEQAVRTGLGILTEGVLVAPTEGIAKVKIKQNPDGSDYVAVYYAGPIRSAGGTAVALSVVLADIARRVCAVGDFRVTETQSRRIVEEILVYENRCVHLQYLPPEEHIEIILSHCPVSIDGEPTEDVEVSAYRNVPGIETNRVRSGVALTICDGLALKAAKLLKITKKLKLGWDWLEKIIKVKSKLDTIEVKPDPTYLEGLVAGRPVFSHASAKGGFRLRYGRSKTNGLMARNVHPATMILLDNFLAYGTHMKIERPGKGCVVAAHDGIEPPVVKLKSGRVMKVRTLEESYAIKSQVAEILFLGDVLTTYGDFRKSNHPLLPSGWCEEWWLRELESKSLSPPDARDAYAMVSFSKIQSVYLHPDYTYHWHDISAEQLRLLVEWLKSGHIEFEDEGKSRIKIFTAPLGPAKRILEELLLEHRVAEGSIIIDGDNAFALLCSLGASLDPLSFSEFEKIWLQNQKPMDTVNKFLKIRAKAPTYIGARMGRPEKAKERKMDGSPCVLFPTGSFKNRSILKQYLTLKSREGEKTLNLDLVRLRCPKCNKLGFYNSCIVCGTLTVPERICQKCGKSGVGEIHCDFKSSGYDRRPVDIVELFESVKAKLDFVPEDVKGFTSLSNPSKIPERLEKGFLRAKYGVFVFRDGTSRFDATDVPLTHFTAREIGISLEKLHQIGYVVDCQGKPITSLDQSITMRHQDVILAENGVTYFMKVAAFIDEMLVNVYGMNSFYNVRKKEDLIGHLGVGLSPHTSAGALCRIIGFTKANVGYAHPYFHTVKRRNCFHPSTKISLNPSLPPTIGKTLGEIVEYLIKTKPEKAKKLLDGTIKIEVEDFSVLSIHPKNFNAKSGDLSGKNIVSREVTCFLKTASPNYWVKLTLYDTRAKKNLEMIVTPDHNILYLDNQNLKALQAKDVRVGMQVPFDSSAFDSHNDLISSISITKVEKIIDPSPAYCLDIETETNDLIEKNVRLENGIFCIRCDGDEDCIMLLMDALINFSRQFLGQTRGGTMDTPLVLSIEVNPKEVDDEAHEMEYVSQYPLEFYEAAQKITLPGEVKIKTVKDVLGTPAQYELPITHPGGSIDEGNCRTAYVTLESIPDKIHTQFSLQERIRAVDQKDAAERLILSHFIPDLYGNLRSFSRQTFRCVSCNGIYRRVPLAGKCSKCGGTLLLTINKGGIQKYLEISRNVVIRYDLPLYLKQRLELVEREIKSIFEDDKSKQMDLSDFL